MYLIMNFKLVMNNKILFVIKWKYKWKELNIKTMMVYMGYKK